jgi:hypothetical protein
MSNAQENQLKLTSIVDVRAFGAKGDGVTDDTAAIQAAIVAVEANSTLNTSTGSLKAPQQLYFPAGRYMVSAPLLITKKITLLGERGPEASTGTRLCKTTDGDLLRLEAAGGGVTFAIEGLTLKSEVSGSGHLIHVAAASPGYNSWRVQNCCFVNPQQLAIKVAGDDVRIIGNTFDVSGYSGKCIQLGDNAGAACSNVVIANNDFFNIPGQVVLVYNARNVLVTGNLVSQPDLSHLVSTTTASFVDAFDPTPTLCDGLTVSGNSLYGVRRLVGGDGVTNVTVTGNNAFEGGIGAGEIYDAMVFSGTCSSINIVGNNIGGQYGAKAAFKNLGTLSNVNLVSNHFSGSSSGVALECGAMTGRVVANTVAGWASPITASDYYALGYINPGVQSPTYGASIDIDARAGEYAIVIATNGTAFTINAPTNPSNGQRLTVQIYNNSGGALGAITWNPVFKLAAFTAPANNTSRLITFVYSSGLIKWTEVSRTTADVPN